MKLPPEIEILTADYNDVQRYAFQVGMIHMQYLAHKHLVEPLRSIGLISTSSSMFTGEINQLCREALTEWDKVVGNG